MQNPLAVPLSAAEAVSFMAPSSLSFPSSHILMSSSMYPGTHDEKGMEHGISTSLNQTATNTFAGVSGIVPTLQ